MIPKPTVLAFAKAIGLLILLFVAVYAPAFAVAGSLSRSPAMIVPLIIAVSLVIAAGSIAFFIRKGGMSAAEFGLHGCAPKYGVVALRPKQTDR